LGNLVGASNVLPRPSQFRLIRPAGHAASLRLVPCMDGVASCAIIRGMRAYGEQRPLGPGGPLSRRTIVIFRTVVVVVGAAAIKTPVHFYSHRTPQDTAGLDLVRTAGTQVTVIGGFINRVVGGSAQDAVEQRTTEFYTVLVDQFGRPLRSKGHTSGETCTSVTRVLAGTRGSE
jgi:hypothetical protein